MSRTPPKLVIDARPQGASGLIAAASVQGRPVIDHLIDLVERVGDPSWTVPVHAREAEHGRLARLLADRPSSRYRLALGPPPEDAVILRSDRLYDADRLLKAIRRGRDPESAVTWRVDRPGALGSGAADAGWPGVDRSPAPRWTTGPAWALARLIAPSESGPARLTLASSGLVVVAGALIAVGRGLVGHQLLPAAALAGALIFDAARAPLARLRGLGGPSDRWLDANLKELADLALHAAVAWSAYAGSGRVGWLVVGTAYPIARGLDRFGAWTAAARPGPDDGRRIAVWGQAAILLAAAGWTPIGLAASTAYFAGRALGRAFREGRDHGA